ATAGPGRASPGRRPQAPRPSFAGPKALRTRTFLRRRGSTRQAVQAKQKRRRAAVKQKGAADRSAAPAACFRERPQSLEPSGGSTGSHLSLVLEVRREAHEQLPAQKIVGRIGVRQAGA